MLTAAVFSVVIHITQYQKLGWSKMEKNDQSFFFQQFWVCGLQHLRRTNAGHARPCTPELHGQLFSDVAWSWRAACATFVSSWGLWGRKSDFDSRYPGTTHCPSSSQNYFPSWDPPCSESSKWMRVFAHTSLCSNKSPIEVDPPWRAVFEQAAQIFNC